MKKSPNSQRGVFNTRLLIAVALCMASACLAGFAINPPASPGPLSLSARVAAQRAVEQVYWNHRIWPKENAKPKPALSEVMPDSAIQAKVEDTLRKSSAVHFGSGQSRGSSCKLR